MKKLVIVGVITAMLMILGCQQQSSESKNSEFIEPDATSWVSYIKPIREYMYYRTQAVLENDMERLWSRYPELRQNVDPETGINVEQYQVEELNRSFDFIDANYDLEAYERIKVKTVNANEVIVLVHGRNVYVRNDFDISGGEYLLEIYLKQTDNGWTVIKTDEYTEEEYKEWMNSA